MEIYIFIIVVAVVVAVFWFLFKCASREQNRRKSAEQSYRAKLQSLRCDPNNPDLREKTLELGRAYSNMMRNNKGHTIFDEMALMNDINAACARATVGQYSVGNVAVTNPIHLRGKSVAQEIEKLGQLFMQGAITAEEYERGKTTFLGAPPDKAASAVELLNNLNALKTQGVLSESEFNMKKWEILSERLISGKKQAATLQQKQPAARPSQAPATYVPSVPCPSCEKGIPEKSIIPGLNACPHCQETYEAET